MAPRGTNPTKTQNRSAILADRFIVCHRLDKRAAKAYNKFTMNEFTVKPVAYIRSDFKEKFGIPRQSGRAPSLTAEIIFTDEYRHPDALRGIEDFSHLWLIFDFSKAHREEFPPPSVRPDLAATRVWAFSRVVPPSVPTPSGFRASSCCA